MKKCHVTHSDEFLVSCLCELQWSVKTYSDNLLHFLRHIQARVRGDHRQVSRCACEGNGGMRGCDGVCDRDARVCEVMRGCVRGCDGVVRGWEHEAVECE